jgi:tetratricopeptide (TPR) repeat protein
MLDNQARLSMTLQLGQQALQADNSVVAMMVAEELLDEEPDHVEGFTLLVESALRCGHAPVAVVAAEQLSRRGVDRPVLLAAALFAAVRLPEALAAADTALALDPRNARAHALRGQVLELLERLEEADAALAEAARIDPRRYPPPCPVDDWESLLFDALSRLSDEDRVAARALPVTFLETPAATWLVETGAPFPPVPPSTFGGPGEGGVLLFRRNLARGAQDQDEVASRIAEVVGDELLARRELEDEA